MSLASAGNLPTPGPLPLPSSTPHHASPIKRSATHAEARRRALLVPTSTYAVRRAAAAGANQLLVRLCGRAAGGGPARAAPFFLAEPSPSHPMGSHEPRKRTPLTPASLWASDTRLPCTYFCDKHAEGCGIPMWHACRGLAAAFFRDCRKAVKTSNLEDETMARAFRGAEPFGRLASGVSKSVACRVLLCVPGR